MAEDLKMRDEDPLSAAFEYDWNYYLPDNLLKKVDMASMFASLECRAPFLDHRLVEFSWNIPSALKVKGDCLKYLLKSALSSYPPTEVLHRSKIGFGASIDSWLRNELRGMLADLLVKGCRAESLIDWTEVQKAQEEFLRPPKPKDYRLAQRLWVILVLELWLRNYA
jgi:asparagine synthase (glutamine-hydrolysing)